LASRVKTSVTAFASSVCAKVGAEPITIATTEKATVKKDLFVIIVLQLT
jgi:hypothetical protein